MYYHVDHLMVTPAEAIKVSRHSSCSVVLKVIPQLYNGIMALKPYDPNKHGDVFVYNCEAIAAIYTAGRLQGIREERIKRKDRKRWIAEFNT